MGHSAFAKATADGRWVYANCAKERELDGDILTADDAEYADGDRAAKN
jgi:hypothetical protein